MTATMQAQQTVGPASDHGNMCVCEHQHCRPCRVGKGWRAARTSACTQSVNLAACWFGRVRYGAFSGRM